MRGRGLGLALAAASLLGAASPAIAAPPAPSRQAVLPSGNPTRRKDTIKPKHKAKLRPTGNRRESKLRRRLRRKAELGMMGAF